MFGVDVRNVKAARRYLGRIGWLVQLRSDHWHRQRWGGKVAVNLAWCESRDDETTAAAAGEDSFDSDSSAVAESESPPLTHQITTESPPPDSHGELPSGSQNQKPAGRGPTGVLQTKEAPKKPLLRDVQPHDLQDTARLLVLFGQAVEAGWIGGSQADQLRFVTAAEHALAVGNSNPCGLFVHLVRQGLWHFATQADEDAANLRLKRHLYGDSRPKDRDNARTERPALPSVALSNDARLAHAALVVHARHGGRGDAFHILRGSYRDWTRERWDKAVGELENARLQRIQAGFALAKSEIGP